MLYTRTELKEINTFEKCKIPLERYMHKFVCERKNIKRLKWHEKNFLFDNMRILRDDNNNKVFDIFSKKIETASIFRGGISFMMSHTLNLRLFLHKFLDGRCQSCQALNL